MKRCKKIIAILLAIIMMSECGVYGGTPVVSAATTSDVEAGTCGDSLVWEYSGGILTISGEGKMNDYSAYQTPWNHLAYDITAVIIKSGVTGIGNYALSDCVSAEKIIFEGSAPSFKTRSFFGTRTTCYYPSDDESWTTEIMNNYGGVLSWVAYKRVEGEIASGTCGQNVQWCLDEQGSLNIFGSGQINDYIEEEPPWYEYKEFINKIVIEEGIEYIGIYAFGECTNVSDVELPESLTTIATLAFCECSSLAEIRISKNVSELGNGVFCSCDSLENIYVDSENEYFSTDGKSVLFDKAKSKLIFAPRNLSGIYKVPDTVTVICMFAFERCDILEEIVFAHNAPEIEAAAFSELNAKCYYPGNNDTWTEDVLQQYGGKITWIEYTGETCLKEHNFDDWYYVDYPTCSKEGLRRRECKSCTNFEEEVVAKTGHRYHSETYPKTDTSVGYIYNKCVGCGFIRIDFNSNNGLTREDAKLVIRSGLLNRDTTVEFIYKDTVQGGIDDAKKLFMEAFEHNGIPNQGDYLIYNNIGAYFCSGKGSSVTDENGFYTNSAKYYSIIYRSTREQEMMVDEAIKRIMAELDLEGDDEYTKIRKIHDYICENVAYDHGLSDISATVYGALINGYAICQGYSLLTYRLMLEAGIDCRFVSGMTSLGPHAWNIVKLNGKYYNIDTTWDDPSPTGRIRYDFFLKGNENFDDHIADDKYLTEEFCEQYPISQTDYRGGKCGDLAYWKLSDDGILSIYGEGALDQVSFVDCPWEEYQGDILEIIVNEGITEIPMYAFKDCCNANSVFISESVKSIGALVFEGCDTLESITFAGDAPEIYKTAFCEISATAVYPGGNDTWTLDVMQNYGGTITWKPNSGDGPVVTPHTHSMTIVYEKMPTCTSMGEKVFTCSTCGVTEKEEIEMAAHEWKTDYTVDRAPTCTEEGSKSIHCMNCSATKDTTRISKVDHIYGEWFIVEEATSSNSGLEKRTCVNCDASETRTFVLSGWKNDGVGWWYQNADGTYPAKCWEKINNQWYYFNASGYRVTGWLLLGSDYYYLDSNGVRVTNRWVGNYYLKDTGIMAKNEIVDNIYVGADGAKFTGWLLKSEGYYYYRKGVKVTGWVNEGSTWYYMNPETGIMLANEWLNDTYYMTAGGEMATGWLCLDGVYYYFNTSGEKVTNSWVGNYYLDEEGHMATNAWVDNGRYYVGASGAYVSTNGWFLLNGEYYYLIKGLKQTGWVNEGFTWYYMNPETGVMLASEWLDDTYYMTASGAMATGWKSIEGEWYYFAQSGAKVLGWQQIGGNWYYFQENGAMASDQWIGTYYIGSDGIWVT